MALEIQTFSIVAGSEACDAKCPYCVSKMNPSQGITLKESEVNWRNFDIAARLAKESKVTTALITSKGEAILFPEQITKYMKHLEEYKFPFIELQTNGIKFYEKEKEYEKYLKEWYDLGMTTIALSIVHYDKEKNKEVFIPHKDYIDLPHLINKLHTLIKPEPNPIGYSVRLTCTMAKDYIDDVDGVERLIDFSQQNNVEQLTVRPVRKPEHSRNKEISDWVKEHELEDKDIDKIRKYLDENGTRLMELAHGAIVYEIDGQNICLSDCLTIEPKVGGIIRQLIFFPDGHLRYDWRYEGAILL